MQEAQTNLKQAAVEFLEAAQAVAAKAAQPSADPLDRVSTQVLDLGDLKPAIGPEDLATMKQRLSEESLAPKTIVDLVALARQVAALLASV